MKARDLSNVIIFVYTLLIVFLIVLACMIADVKKHSCEEKRSYNGFATKEELLAMRYLHRYHGTLSSENGYFYRNGEKCLLFDPRVRTDR